MMTNDTITLLTALLLAPLAALQAAEPLTTSLAFETTLVDSNVVHGATFQSNNQKVVRNKRGIFMTHLRSRNEKYTAQQWRLSWSKDDGRTFTTLYEATDATNPPVLETDSSDNLYIGHPDWVSLDVLLYRFLASEDYRTPHITRAPKAAAGKYSMEIDEKRGQVCYFSHSGKFVRFGLDGSVKSSTLLLKHGGKAVQEYTHLNLAADGTLHAAWTSLFVPKRLYWGIHHLQSPDGGATWQPFAGKPAKLPIVADETGPSDRITLDDEFEVSTWLSNFLVKDGKAHFLYMAHTKPIRQHYVRCDVATGKREIDQYPAFRGGKLGIQSLAGFFATSSKKPGSPLFCVARGERGTRIVCLRSDDNGATWRDHAVSAPFRQPYAIGGCREVTPDGWVIGSFTDVINAKVEGPFDSRVYFFRIPARGTP
jgi:hypothetical protein